MVGPPAWDAVRLVEVVDPHVARLLDEAVRVALDVGGRTLELADQRVAMLLGEDTEPLSAPASLSDSERACLALAEQYAVNVSQMTDSDVTAAAKHLTPAELFGFVAGLYTLEMARRVGIALRAVLDEVPA
jgi:alkylhydroperoxidase family enzyme